jgi:hypothetical protein
LKDHFFDSQPFAQMRRSVEGALARQHVTAFSLLAQLCHRWKRKERPVDSGQRIKISCAATRPKRIGRLCGQPLSMSADMSLCGTKLTCRDVNLWSVLEALTRRGADVGRIWLVTQLENTV